eukprot:1192671-Amorphochlora_amoeboformis.AAC.1
MLYGGIFENNSRFRRALSIPWKNARPNKRDAIVRYTKQAEWNGRKLGEMVDPEELRMKGIEDMYQREVEWGPGFMTDEEIDKWAIPHGVDSNMTYFEVISHFCNSLGAIAQVPMYPSKRLERASRT